MVKALELDSKNSTVIQGVNNFASTSFKSKACKYWTAAQTSVFSMHSFNLHCIQVQGSGLICISKSRLKTRKTFNLQYDYYQELKKPKEDQFI